MKVSSRKMNSERARTKDHVAKTGAVGLSVNAKGAAKAASVDIEIDGRRYHIRFEAGDFGLKELAENLTELSKQGGS